MLKRTTDDRHDLIKAAADLARLDWVDTTLQHQFQQIEKRDDPNDAITLVQHRNCPHTVRVHPLVNVEEDVILPGHHRLTLANIFDLRTNVHDDLR